MFMNLTVAHYKKKFDNGKFDSTRQSKLLLKKYFKGGFLQKLSYLGFFS